MKAVFSFNLVEQPWIPCVDQAGRLVELSLSDTLAQAPKLRAIIGDTPPVTAALHRLLLTMLHRVFGPADRKQWLKLWQAEQWDLNALDRYLEQWKHKFDLFDSERPFYQATDSRVRPKSVLNLRHDRASGNNPTLFDHHTEAQGETLTPAQAARALVTIQAYGLAGLSGISGHNFTDGSCAGGILFLVEGDTLKETLLLNLIKYPPDNDLFPIHSALDAPAWEMDNPFVPERVQPFGYLDYLTWQNRRIHLIPESAGGSVVVKQMTLAPGLRLDSLPLDPMKNYRIDDQKLGPLATNFSENRVLWRDSASLFALNPHLQGKSRPPATLRWLQSLIENTGAVDDHHVYRTLSVGMSKKQAKVYFFREERLPLPLAYLKDEQLVGALDTALQDTGKIAFDLVQAARLMGMYIHLPSVDQNSWQKQWQSLNANAKNEIVDWITHTGVERNYWARLETAFQTFIVNLPTGRNQALTAWYTDMAWAARASFEQTTQFAGEDARAFKAVVRGRGYLDWRIREVMTAIPST